ncbi:hypothetical protein EYR40_009405 [Pleurotus pulmonarius]|nr:hypothetical protein EYR36_005219 [Pleurotus pulmonarius]KAF4590196.1 hypothetical protein EYR38_009494 [Pleurotus pulmonarius]KAF4590808.1 hypothetical protein EYR40_009405 [Pleurotus pulmonarius]
MPNANSSVITDYAPPVIRAPSPPSSVGSDKVLLPDLPDPDKDLTPAELERKIEESLGLHRQRHEEILAEEDPLIPKPKTEAEEKERYQKAMEFLRRKVAEIVDNELVDQTILRGSRVGLEPLPSSTNIDTIMRNMMNTSLGGQTADVTPGPWMAPSTETQHGGEETAHQSFLNNLNGKIVSRGRRR